ncbi:MAG: hypothetical protein IID33_05470 [Planctomycetes bacterium]|nr:hypothetical protein [Planctomycetota bacterium]
MPPMIGKLANLTELTLNANPITDADLEHLKTLKRLKLLDVRGTKVTRQGVEAIKRALPKCRIIR